MILWIYKNNFSPLDFETDIKFKFEINPMSPENVLKKKLSKDSFLLIKIFLRTQL